MSVTESTAVELYLQGVESLLQGRFQEAVRFLQPAAAEGSANARLALGRAHLELQSGPEAAAQFDALLQEEPVDPGMLAYLHLLSASAAALAGAAEEAEKHLDAAQAADARLEPAARALRRRIRKGRLPLVRF